MIHLFILAAGTASLTTAMSQLIFLRSQDRTLRRVRELSPKSAQSEQELIGRLNRLVRESLPKMGESLAPADKENRSRMALRLVHAGFYGPNAVPIYLSCRLLLSLIPALVGTVLYSLGIVTTQRGVMNWVAGSAFVFIGTGHWLDRRKAQRQRIINKGLPDAVDLIVICLSGGLSLNASVQRVTDELETSHPQLARELRIIEREIHLGSSLPEALLRFAERTDLSEIRSLSSVVSVAERFGSSICSTLESFASELRLKRKQAVEKLARKAAIKILIPTLLFIFPSIFIVILAPAALRIYGILGGLVRR
jgi:tight adherence protein C